MSRPVDEKTVGGQRVGALKSFVLLDPGAGGRCVELDLVNGSLRESYVQRLSISFWGPQTVTWSGWPRGLRRCVQVAVHFCGRGFESHF